MGAEAEALAARLRQAVQGCTVHPHGPVHAWQAVEQAVGQGKATREQVAQIATSACLARLRELTGAGVPEDDPRVRKERTALAFIRIVLREPEAPTRAPIELLEQACEGERAGVLGHPVYRVIGTAADLRVYMEHHVFAVWDFMCLLKALQRAVTCVTDVWRPVGSPTVRRWVNEIVVGEESDLIDGEVVSHFEMYVRAMREVGADVGPVEEFVRAIERGSLVSNALDACGAPEASREFVLTTMDVVNRGHAHEIAAAFTVGREQTIPGMFRQLIDELTKPLAAPCPSLLAYLERHVTLDGDDHGPASRQLLASLCGDDEVRWEAATQVAKASLAARSKLWDGVHAAILRRIASVTGVTFTELVGERRRLHLA